jgi:hypothetical protein
LHNALFLLRPVFAFGLSVVSTLGVWRLTLPALLRPPCLTIANFLSCQLSAGAFCKAASEKITRRTRGLILSYFLSVQQLKSTTKGMNSLVVVKIVHKEAKIGPQSFICS